MVDAHSKWLEAIMMTSTTAEKTITELHKVFASYGLPEQLVTDNGPQFTSSDFDVFMKCNHILTAPYHPKSNGEAKKELYKCSRMAYSHRKWKKMRCKRSSVDFL